MNWLLLAIIQSSTTNCAAIKEKELSELVRYFRYSKVTFHDNLTKYNESIINKLSSNLWKKDELSVWSFKTS